MESFRKITGLHAIPDGKQYWTLCNNQPDDPGSEIVQLVNAGFLKKSQFFGIDYDLEKKGIIDHNKRCHPEANWFEGDWLDVIAENYDNFNPAFVYLDATRTVLKNSCHVYVAKTMNWCPSQTVFAVNLMLSDGRSSKKFDPKILVEGVRKHLMKPNEWIVSEQYFSYKSSYTDMGIFVFARK